MKLFFTLTFLLLAIVTTASGYTDSLPAAKAQPATLAGKRPQATEQIIMRCGSSCSDAPALPLIIVDGVVREYDQLRELDPNDIASITILKEGVLASSCRTRAMNGVVLITTKAALQRKFVIRDFLTGDKVPKASIYFSSPTDSLRAMTDDNGILQTTLLKQGVCYKMTVTSAGYKTFSTNTTGTKQEILLQRDVKLCDEVRLVAYSPTRRIDYGCTLTSVTGYELISVKDSSVSVSAMGFGIDHILRSSVYPNPVLRNSPFNLEIESNREGLLRIIVSAMTGQRVLTREQKLIKGRNQYSIVADPRWAAGIYIIRLTDEKGYLVSEQKIVVQ